MTAIPLGRPVSYRDTYAPDLLFPIPRQGKRDEIGVDGAALPFVGMDVWNAYEVSWLNPRGKPMVALGRFVVPAGSPCLVESKSLKLYLNSLNQSRYPDVETVRTLIARDLSAANGVAVEVELIPLFAGLVRHFGMPEGVLLDELDIEIETYQPAPGILFCASGETQSGSVEQLVPAGTHDQSAVRPVDVSETLYSHLLKSNCLVTGQPDWGTVVVRYQGPQIDHASLLRYIVSFRKHDEFHEQCVERMFCDILRQCRPQQLGVWARYTRRGGLDINPYRATPGMCWRPEDQFFEVRQ